MKPLIKTTHTLSVLLAGIAAAHATPSGLNNIPTADTTPQGTFVLQGFTTVGNGRDADFNLGFKTGIDLKAVKLELGLASHLVPGKGGPVEVHGKVSVPLGEGLPVIAAGAANISFTKDDRRRAGDTFAYFVVSQDFRWFRAHAGLAVQDSQPLPFFGVDKTFRIAKSVSHSDGKASTKKGGKAAVKTETEYRDLFTLRADAIQQTNHRWLASVGALIPVCKHFVFEAWGNFPTDGTQASATLKGNVVFSF
ncbi:MAG: hypothetical protein NTV08_00335 [Verrucomicrobia bacterium]|nr:hypothetical protein [Verrucomicrobiota bacterium]